MKKAKYTIILSVLWITIPSAFSLAQEVKSPINRLTNSVDNARESFEDIRELQRDLDRLEEIRSRTDRFNDKADSELRKIREEERLSDKLRELRKRRNRQSLENDFELQVLERELTKSRQELAKAKRIEKIEKELADNEKELQKLNPEISMTATVKHQEHNFDNGSGTSPKDSLESGNLTSSFAELDKKEILGRIGDSGSLENNPNSGLYENPIDSNIGTKYLAYAITELEPEDQLDRLQSILGNGLNQDERKFVLPLVNVDPENIAGMGTTGNTVYYGASFIVLWENSEEKETGKTEAVVVNNMFYHAIKELARVYPAVDFVRSDEVNEKL